MTINRFPPPPPPTQPTKIYTNDSKSSYWWHPRLHLSARSRFDFRAVGDKEEIRRTRGEGKERAHCYKSIDYARLLLWRAMRNIPLIKLLINQRPLHEWQTTMGWKSREENWNLPFALTLDNCDQVFSTDDNFSSSSFFLFPRNYKSIAIATDEIE